MRDAVAVEWLKLRRARVPWVAAVVAVVLLPLLGLAFTRLAGADVEGPLAAKLGAMVVGSGWTAYLGTLGQLVAVGQFLAVGFVVVWCFGREFVDRTVGALFALPVGRGTIAGAKVAVLAAWSLALVLALVGVVALAGVAAGLEGPTRAAAVGLARLAGLAGLSSLLAVPLAVVASVARGHLAGVGALIGLVAAAQVAVLFGVGGWFPFAAPGLWAVSWVDPTLSVTTTQLLLVPAAAVAGAGTTVWWWSRFEVS